MRWWTSMTLWILVFTVLGYVLHKIGAGDFIAGALCAITAIRIQEKIEMS
jgi:hypothetical protein